MSLLWALASCVLDVRGAVVVDEPIDRVEIDLDRGSVELFAADGETGVVEYHVRGIGEIEVIPEVRDGILVIEDPCGDRDFICQSDVVLELPPEVDVDVRIGAGSLESLSMKGHLTAQVGGRIDVRRHTGRVVDVVSSSGQRLDLGFDAAPERVEALLAAGPIVLSVPPGAYALDLQAAGTVVVDPEILIDPTSASALVVTAEDGSITVEAN